MNVKTQECLTIMHISEAMQLVILSQAQELHLLGSEVG